MLGPIASAFVDITARLRLEKGNELEKGLRGQIRRIESDLERLEGAAAQTGRGIARQLSDVRLNLNVREALGSLERVDNAVENVTSELHNLRDEDLGFNTAAATRNLKTLDDRVAKLLRDVQIIDDEEVNIDTKSAIRNLEVLDRAVNRLTTELADIARISPDIDLSEAANDLQQLEEEIGNALRDLGRLDGKQVKVNVEDLEVDSLTRKVDRLDGESIELKVDTSGLRSANSQLQVAEDHAGALKGAFSRIVAFGLIREAGQAIGQLFAAGVRASGAIQTTTVTLNRFFAQTRDLGQTSTEFIGNIKKLALETPFEFKGLAETSRRILGMGVNADEAVGLLTDLSDAVAAVGGGQGEIDGVVRALSQLSSKGKVDLQDFRQISENLPSLSRQLQIQGVIDELNDLHPGLQATFADFEDLRKSGLITGKVLRDGIVRAISDIPGVAGAARAASRTLQGALSNLADFATIEFSSAFAGLGGIIADELNAAFGSVTNGEELSPLADSIRNVIEAFGRAGESVLPGILEGIITVAPEVSGLVDQIANSIESLTELFANMAAGGLRSFSGLTAIITQVTSLLNVLPEGLQELIGGFVTLSTVIPGAGETLKNSFKGLVVALKAVIAGEEGVALAASVMNVALTAGLILAVTLITSELGKASQRSDEFKQSISDAARSLQEFDDFGDGVLDFINQFRIAGEGVNIGGLEKFFDGLTTGEIETALGATSEQVATLVGDLSRAGEELSRAELDKALADAGISAEQLAAAGDDALISIQALSDQVAAGAQRTFDAALANGKYALVTDEVAASIAAAAQTSGDYTGALEKLDKANQSAAQTELGKARALGATEAQIADAIAANTDLETGTIDYVAALQQLTGELQAQETLFQGLQERYKGFTETLSGLRVSTDALAANPNALGEKFVSFALAVDKAGLSAEEMNAIANELGDTLGQVFSGAELTSITTAFVADVETFKSSLESVVPGIDDLQFEADSFSLDGFLEQLNRITEARFRVSGNITRLLNEFGTVGERALAALLNSGLTKDQFAIALEEGIAGGEAKLGEIGERFAAATGPQIQVLSERLASLGFNQERIDEILGVTAFEGGVTDLGAAVDGIDPIVTALEEKVGKLNAAIEAADSPGIKRLLGEAVTFTQSQISSAENPAAAAGIDQAAATAAADAAGDVVGAAFTSSVQASIVSNTAGATTAISQTLSTIANVNVVPAITAGTVIANSFTLGFTLGILRLSTSLGTGIGIATLNAAPVVKTAGLALGDGFTTSFKKAIDPKLQAVLNTVLKTFERFTETAGRQLSEGGNSAVSAFKQSLDGLFDVVLAESARTLQAFRVLGISLTISAIAAGNQVTTGFDAGLNLSSVVVKEISAVSKAFTGTAIRTQSYNYGQLIGFDLGRGVAAGISNSITQSVNAIIKLVAETVNAGKSYAKVKSPSRLFAELGAQLGAGVAAGMISSIPEVAAAATAVIAAAEGRTTGSVNVATRTLRGAGSLLQANPLASGALQRLSDTSSAVPGAATTSAVSSVVNYNTFHVAAPTEDAEALALRVAARLERRLSL